MTLLIKAKDIWVEYLGRDVLDISALEIYDYDRIGLVGSNGAGTFHGKADDCSIPGGMPIEDNKARESGGRRDILSSGWMSH